MSILVYKKGIKAYILDYTQKKAIELEGEREKVPFYLTWNKEYMSEKTHVLIQDRNLHQFEQNINSIRYKK